MKKIQLRPSDIPHQFLAYVGEETNILGEIEQGDDGYYHFWPRRDRVGYWDTDFLRKLADVIDELNKVWDNQVKEALSGTD